MSRPAAVARTAVRQAAAQVDKPVARIAVHGALAATAILLDGARRHRRWLTAGKPARMVPGPAFRRG